MNNQQQWKCKRCGEIVDMVNFRCGCVSSPSPWEPVQETAEKPMSKEGANRLLNAIMALLPATSPEDRAEQMRLQEEAEAKRHFKVQSPT